MEKNIDYIVNQVKKFAMLKDVWLCWKMEPLIHKHNGYFLEENYYVSYCKKTSVNYKMYRARGHGSYVTEREKDDP